MPPSFKDRKSSLGCEIEKRSDLAHCLGVSDRALRYFLYRMDGSVKYKNFTVTKRNGGLRNIAAPAESLKYLQRQLAQYLEELSPPRKMAKAYVKGLSIYDHARIHRSKKWVVLADLKDFFPSINFGRVLGMFKSPPFCFGHEAAVAAAQLCTKDGSLPQGAPTSPVISNIICRKLDRELNDLSRAAGFSVSRYADDICFSSNRSSPSPLICDFVSPIGWVPGVGLTKVISDNGFSLNHSKFKVSFGRERKLVTGLVVNKGVSVPRYWRRQLRSALHVFNKFGEADGSLIVDSWPGFRRNESSRAINSVAGKISYLNWVDRVSGRSVVDGLRRGFPELSKIFPIPDSGFRFRIMAEGPTDLIHLKSSLDYFRGLKDFGYLFPRFSNYPGDVGDKDLWETLRRIAKADIGELTIGVFDCDDDSFMKKNSLSPGSFVKLGSRVYAMCLSPAVHVSGGFCIESLYPACDATLKDDMGRRLFFKSEFDEGTGLTADGAYKCKFPKKKAIVVSDSVERVSDGFSSLLSKSEFAANIENKVQPFDGVSFEGFRATWSVIRSIVLEDSR